MPRLDFKAVRRIGEMRPRVLAVDDELEFLELEQRYLGNHQMDVTSCVSSLDAVDEARSGDFDLVVSDYQMPELDGIELLKILRKEGCGIGFILFTGKGREDVAIAALNEGADYYLQKGTDLPSLFALLARIVDEVCDSRRSEKALVESQNLLRISNQRLDLLGSITRHDIRGEVTIADGYLGLAEEETAPDILRAHLSKARHAIGKILGIIEIARTYQINGAMNIKWSSLDAALKSAAASVDMSGLTYTNTADDWIILVDPLLEMVCANILSNTVRHGVHATKITVSAEEQADGLYLTLEDDGVGIAQDQKNRIFDFMAPSGVPHGLSIAKRILEAEQIDIEETGTYGEGARFVLHFPPGLYRPKTRI